MPARFLAFVVRSEPQDANRWDAQYRGFADYMELTFA